jgi:hypothetical protein
MAIHGQNGHGTNEQSKKRKQMNSVDKLVYHNANAGGLFNKAKEIVKEVKQDRKVSKEIRQDYRGDKKEIKGQNLTKEQQKKALEDLKKGKKTALKTEGGGTFFNKLHRALATPQRLGVLLAFRLNLAGIASRLYPAVVKPESWTKEKIKKDAGAKATEAFKKIKLIFSRMGGDISELENTIKAGARKKVAKLRKVNGKAVVETPTTNLKADGWNYPTGVEEGAAAASTAGTIITSALAALTAIFGYLQATKVEKNPFEGTDSQGLSAAPDAVGQDFSSQEAAEAAIQQIQNDKSLSAAEKQQMIDYIKQNGYDTLPPVDSDTGASGGFFAKNWYWMVGGAVLLAVGAIFMFKRK